MDGTVATAEDGRSRILAAGLQAFAANGFEGTSLRDIADQAGVQHQLVVYHFRTKEGVWRAVVSSIFAGMEQQTLLWRRRLAQEGPAVTLKALIQEFVQFTARRPEFHRIATFEGRTDNARLRWLLDTYVRPYYELSTEILAEAQRVGAARAGEVGQIHYAVIGIVTTSLVFEQEYRLMTGLDPFASNQIEALTSLVLDFLGFAD